MAFTTWDDMITAIKDALMDYVAGAPCIGEYNINGRKIIYRSAEDLKNLLKFAIEMNNLDSQGDQSTCVSYGVFRR